MPDANGRRTPEEYRAALEANRGTGPLGGTPEEDAAKGAENDRRNQEAWEALGPAADQGECPGCDGTGDCDQCDGNGCADCDGSGDCQECDGTGEAGE